MGKERTDISMVDLTGQYLRLKPEIDEAVQQVLNRGDYINGAAVKSFRDTLAGYLEAEYVVPCANGTDALQAALMALNLDPGDEIITSAFSFVSTVEVIMLLGLKPVLVDVDPDTFNIDPDAIRGVLTERTRVVIPVHLFGQPAQMEEIMEIALAHNLYVIEDAAQSLGASCFVDGKQYKAGTIGHIGCTSFFPTKNLGCFGDGGACFTNDELLGERVRMIVNHGARRKYFNEMIGMNSRLDTLQAAVLSEKLIHLDDFIDRRQKAARVYFEELKNVSEMKLPFQAEGISHTFNQFTVRVPEETRGELKRFLEDQGIPSMVYYPLPLHRQPAFQARYKDDMHLPESELACKEVLSLPIHTEMTETQQEFIIQKIRMFFGK